MPQHVEWLDATHTAVAVITPEDNITGTLAQYEITGPTLLLSADDAVCITGTIEQLEKLLMFALTKVRDVRR